MEIKRRPGFVVTVSKSGFKTVTTSVVSSISGGGGTAMAVNVLLGGVIGAGVLRWIFKPIDFEGFKATGSL